MRANSPAGVQSSHIAIGGALLALVVAMRLLSPLHRWPRLFLSPLRS